MHGPGTRRLELTGPVSFTADISAPCRPTGRSLLSDRLLSLCCHWLAGSKGLGRGVQLSRERAIKRVAFQTNVDDALVPKVKAALYLLLITDLCSRRRNSRWH